MFRVVVAWVVAAEVFACGAVAAAPVKAALARAF
jgi:hypothetical protein